MSKKVINIGNLLMKEKYQKNNIKLECMILSKTKKI